MHPAYSVILFTTASGAGYGLLFWLSVMHLLGVAPDGRWLLFVAIAVALALVTIGLLASTLHLGRPERAVGAFSQWRTSWLSREGVAAVATYVPSGLLALMWLLGFGSGVVSALLALLAAVGAVVTVYCTGMIYASLRTIRQWNLELVPAGYLAMAAATGALLFGFLLALFGHAPSWAATLSLLGLGVGAALKVYYWQTIDADEGQYTSEMATGLGHLGQVKPLDPPHTRPNFVMREMGYEVARKHAHKLRRLVLACLFAVPALLLLALLTVGGSGAMAFYFLAIGFAAVGVFVERWLFFAEAEHVSMLFYGKQRA
ncbi:MAG: dimethyl sulfoxide reductase anchor subunit [Alphaproteobacteria bacterium]|nr:dimethyl sulfoxide reductase anchor subunit [Alphaproteobacteria bacterium]